MSNAIVSDEAIAPNAKRLLSAGFLAILAAGIGAGVRGGIVRAENAIGDPVGLSFVRRKLNAGIRLEAERRVTHVEPTRGTTF